MKRIIDERTGWEYELQGDYYYPTGRVQKDGVMTPETVDDEPDEEMPVGTWGQRYLRYLRQYKKSLYLDLFMSGKLNAYLADLDEQAEDLFLRLVKEMAEQEGVTEKLKSEDQMRWIGMMNNIRNRATEIMCRELIFV